MLERQTDAVRDFLQAAVCDKIELKAPDRENEYRGKWVRPGAFSMYLPMIDHLPPGIEHAVPSIIVMPLTGEDEPKEGAVSMRLVLTIYEPGTREEGGAEAQEPAYMPDTTEGWRTLSNLIDNTRRALRNAAVVGGMEVLYPIKYGLFNPNEETPDYRPFYMGWIEISLRYGIQTAYDEEIRQFL